MSNSVSVCTHLCIWLLWASQYAFQLVDWQFCSLKNRTGNQYLEFAEIQVADMYTSIYLYPGTLLLNIIHDQPVVQEVLAVAP